MTTPVARPTEDDAQRPPSTPALVAFDAAMLVAAVAAVAGGFWKWHLYGPPVWNPVSVLGLLSIPLLTRFSITVSRDAEANVLGLTAAVLFSSEFSAPSHIFPLWAVLVMASSIAFKGGWRYGVPRATDDIVAGWALVTVAPHVNLGVRPFDRTLVSLATFLAVLALVFWIRRRLSGQQAPQRGLDVRSTALALGGLYFASVFIAALRRIFTQPSPAGDAEVAVMGLSLVVAALIGYSVSQQLLRGVAILSEAATSLPWPAEDNDSLVRRFARRAVRSSSAEIVPAPGPSGTLSAPVDAVRHLVLRRRPGDQAFSRSEQRLVEAVAAMATISRSVDLREAGLRLRGLTDALTGLWTYSMFDELITQAGAEREEGEVLALLFLDLDRFKQLNEELGHFDADVVLREIATRLQDGAPETAIAARFAGDEFAVLLRDVERSTLQQDVQGLVDTITAPIAVAGRLLTVHVSVGIGVSEQATDDIHEVMRTAEANMRKAKHVGRAATGSRDEIAMVSAAVEGDSTSVVFQPILDARTGELWGCEALVRATDPELGEVSPLTLVSSAARQRSLDALTHRVGREALDAMEVLGRRVRTPLTLTVNLEFDQFRVDSPVLESLSEMLRERGASLVLELSERSYGRWTSQHDVLAERLKKRGIRLAIDDFGAGYATFGLLNKWGWDIVKIDKSLATASDDQSRLLFSNIVRTLRDLGLVTVAEGVETPQQLDAARRAGVALIQGHLVCEAVDMDELLRRVGPDGDGLSGLLARAGGALPLG